MSAQRGQTTTEFAMTATVLLGLLLAVIDLGRAGVMQHNLDGAAADLARSLATLSGTNSSGNTSTYVPTALDPSNATTAAQMQADLVHAGQVGDGAFATTPLTTTGAVTLTNGAVTVVGGPNLTAPTAITVTITAPFTSVVGIFLKNTVLHLQATSTAITPAGQ